MSSPPHRPVICPQVQTSRDAGAAPAGGPHREPSGPVERHGPCKLPLDLAPSPSFHIYLTYPPSSKRESWQWWEDPRGHLQGGMLLPTSARARGTGCLHTDKVGPVGAA